MAHAKGNKIDEFMIFGGMAHRASGPFGGGQNSSTNWPTYSCCRGAQRLAVEAVRWFGPLPTHPENLGGQPPLILVPLLLCCSVPCLILPAQSKVSCLLSLPMPTPPRPPPRQPPGISRPARQQATHSPRHQPAQSLFLFHPPQMRVRKHPMVLG